MTGSTNWTPAQAPAPTSQVFVQDAKPQISETSGPSRFGVTNRPREKVNLILQMLHASVSFPIRDARCLENRGCAAPWRTPGALWRNSSA